MRSPMVPLIQWDVNPRWRRGGHTVPGPVTQGQELGARHPSGLWQRSCTVLASDKRLLENTEWEPVAVLLKEAGRCWGI